MEPRKEVFNEASEQRKETTKNRFQIMKLKERIAPGCRWHDGQGRYVGNGRQCR